VVRTPGGEVIFDPTGKAAGRGAWLCKNADCIEKARKNNSLARALKTPTPPSVYEHLLASARGGAEERQEKACPLE
jgi:predicted RNA-binding protein YlxR (DUF448 family)